MITSEVIKILSANVSYLFFSVISLDLYDKINIQKNVFQILAVKIHKQINACVTYIQILLFFKDIFFYKSYFIFTEIIF